MLLEGVFCFFLWVFLIPGEGPNARVGVGVIARTTGLATSDAFTSTTLVLTVAAQGSLLACMWSLASLSACTLECSAASDTGTGVEDCALVEGVVVSLHSTAVGVARFECAMSLVVICSGN